jgi:hypothetical protein
MRPTTSPPTRIAPQRLRHMQNEALLARDFADQAAQDHQMRWWHNRAIHDTYGIVRGLEVGDSTGRLIVTPGLAYDSFGRELVLREEWHGDIPDGAETVVLVISRSDVARCSCARTPGGYCREHQAADSSVTLRWQPLSTFSVHDGVALTSVSGGILLEEAERHHERPLARARVGHGATVPGGTAWSSWTEVRDEIRWHLGLQVEVDTSAAGFTAVPCYFAQIIGSMWDARLPGLFVLPFQHIAAPDRDHFTFRLLAPWLFRARSEPATPAGATEATRSFASAFRGLTSMTELAITWAGIQHEPMTPARGKSTSTGGRRGVD